MRASAGLKDAARRAMLHETAREIWTEVRAKLTGANVECLPVKGVVTSHWLYENPADRELTDVDIRIRPRDLLRARLVAKSAGWTITQDSRIYGQLGFTVGGFEVDIESSCGPPGFVALTIDQMLARAVTSSNPRLAALGPIPELHDHVLLLIVNVVKDHVTLAQPWAIDDLRRVARLPDFDSSLLLSRAALARMVGMVFVIADQLAPNEPRWADIRHRILDGHRMSHLFARVYSQVVRNRGPNWALRLGARLTSDGWIRPMASLARAAVWEATKPASRRAGAR